MTEEKPVSEQTEQTASSETSETVAELEALATEATEDSTAPASESTADSIAAALSALSSAAAPARDDDGAVNAPEPENVTVSFSPAPSTETTTDRTTPPPPPAPEEATEESYPPPTGTPIAVVAVPAAPASNASTDGGTMPPAPTSKRKKWPWILAISIVALLLLIGGVAACTSSMMNLAFHTSQHNERYHDYDDLFNPETNDGLWNFYYGGGDESFESLLEAFNVDEGVAEADGSCMKGAYRVGGDDGIEPGLYYFEGSQEGVSHFYLFHDSSDAVAPSYDADSTMASIGVEYFGNYYADLEDGDVIVFIPFDDDDVFHPVNGPMNTMPPYESGCYRVGIDIPAGTYTVTCQTEAARVTDSEAGAFVMKDVDFNADSILDTAYVIKGGRQTITVKDGEYLELFAAIATPATASTQLPLQHAKSEVSHVS